jgi:hypothetical protein
MSFTIEKSLGNSSFRFAVGRRRELRSIDDDPELSTGPAGEFVRHRPEIFYSSDLRTIHKPEVPQMRALTTTPFWSSVFDGTPRSWAFIGLMVLGALFALIGVANLAQGRPAGWLPLLLGLVIAAIPLFVTAQKRHSVRQLEERKRREREERDKRNAERLEVYTKALESLRENPNDETLDTVLRENEKLDLPYAVWADAAIGTVLYVGFSTLAKVGPDRAAEVAALMDRASDAAGLIAEDAIGVKHALYSTVLWHLVADDRLGAKQLEVVRAVQKGFGIAPEDVPHDTLAESQFERLRGVDHRNAPRCEDPALPLGINEYCLFSGPVKLEGQESTTIWVTSRRVVVGSGSDGKRTELLVPKVDDVVVDADRNRITVRAVELKRPLDFHAAEPIYLAAMIDLATRLDDRPKSFA